MTEVLIDTNVLIYALDKGSEFHMWSMRFFEDPNFSCCTTSKNLSEFLCVLTRGPSPALRAEEAINAIKVFLTHCKLLYPDSASLQTLCELVIKHDAKGLLIHDYEIASIALANDIHTIASVNRADFTRISGLEVISPNSAAHSP